MEAAGANRKNRLFGATFILKPIVSPRQARDKHKETLKSDAFCANRNAHVTGRFNEAGYIAIPDCLWGSAEHGLEAPRNLTGVPLFILKTANATRAHYGEMAGGQAFTIPK